MAELTTGRTKASDGVEVAWDRRGEGPPMVLVHGITDDRTTWRTIPELFVAGGHEVITIDLRGHGESGRPDDPAAYDAVRMATDLVEVCEDLDLDAPALVGHSLGGMLVTVAAVTAPCRAVVNVDQHLRLSRFAEALGPLHDELYENFHEALAKVFAPLASPGLDEETAAEIDATTAAADKTVVLSIWGPVLEGDPAETEALVDAFLPQVQCPYLALHGIDPGDDYQSWLAERIPDLTYELWADQGHYIHLVDPVRFVARVNAFLS